MKRENFIRVKAIITMIEDYEKRLEALNSNYISVQIVNKNGYPLESVDKGEKSELGQIGDKYIEALILYYETEIHQLNKELETL